MCPLLVLFEFFLFGGQFGIVTSLIFVFLVFGCISQWFSSMFYYHPWFEAHLVSSIPVRKRDRYFKAIETKLLWMTLVPYVVIVCSGCALVALKYLTGTSSQRYLFGVYLLYAPYCWFIITGLMTNMLVCDLLQVIANDVLQILQTEEIKSWTAWWQLQLHLKTIRKKVEAACYHIRLYIATVMIVSVIFVVSFGNLIIGLPAETVTLITDMLLFAASILLMFTILYPCSSVTDRTEKYIKYSNMAIASRWFLLRSPVALVHLKYVQLARVQFKCYGMLINRMFLMKAMVLTISFMFISVGRLDWLFS